jgi:hypothetical protein
MGYGNINYRHQKRGYPLTLEEIGRIREQYVDGKSKLQLALEYQVSYRTIDRVVRQLDQFASDNFGDTSTIPNIYSA